MFTPDMAFEAIVKKQIEKLKVWTVTLLNRVIPICGFYVDLLMNAIMQFLFDHSRHLH